MKKKNNPKKRKNGSCPKKWEQKFENKKESLSSPTQDVGGVLNDVLASVTKNKRRTIQIQTKLNLMSSATFVASKNVKFSLFFQRQAIVFKKRALTIFTAVGEKLAIREVT